jgi:hypothetical protein
MYFVMEPFHLFTAFENIEIMLDEFLMEEDEYDPAMITNMTGIAIEDQVCLEKTEIEEEETAEATD